MSAQWQRIHTVIYKLSLSNLWSLPTLDKFAQVYKNHELLGLKQIAPRKTTAAYLEHQNFHSDNVNTL